MRPASLCRCPVDLQTGCPSTRAPEDGQHGLSHQSGPRLALARQTCDRQQDRCRWLEDADDFLGTLRYSAPFSPFACLSETASYQRLWEEENSERRRRFELSGCGYQSVDTIEGGARSHLHAVGRPLTQTGNPGKQKQPQTLCMDQSPVNRC